MAGVKPIRSFVDMLPILNRGRFVEMLDEHLTHALETLEKLPNEKGVATITVAIAIAFDGGRIDIKPSVKSKLPEGRAFGGTPFWSYGGGLSVQHPSQMDLALGPRDAADRDRASA